MKQIGVLLVSAFVLSCGAVPQPVEAAPSIEVIQPAPVQSTPQPVETAPVVEVVEPAAPVQNIPPPEEPSSQVVENIIYVEQGFDPGNISEELFTNTKAEVQALIGNLNGIIRARNYDAWVGHLAASYLSVISSGEFLAERTEELYRRDQTVASNLGRNPNQVQKKILRTPRDYFENVVVPSRSNDRMDDIEFITENRVKAYTIDSRGNRLVLYDLEMIDNFWKIVH